MPSKKTYSKRRYRQKRKVRRRSAPRNGSNMTITRGPLPNKHKATLSFVSHEVLNPGVGAITTLAFSANGLFDPYLALGGHQPRGFDQMMTMFQKYTVIGSRIKVSFNTLSTIPSIFVVATREAGAPFESTYVNYLENGNCVYKAYQPGQGSTPTLTQSYSPRKFNSIKDTLDNGAFAGSATANPDKGADWHIVVGAADHISDAGACTIVVEISYIVVFHDPISLTIS